MKASVNHSREEKESSVTYIHEDQIGVIYKDYLEKIQMIAYS